MQHLRLLAPVVSFSVRNGRSIQNAFVPIVNMRFFCAGKKIKVDVLKANDTMLRKPDPNMFENMEMIEDEEDELEDMFVEGPSLGKIEWGGPTRGGRRPEPTRYGDWDRNGRVSDF